MTPKKICVLFSFLSLVGTGTLITFSNFDTANYYSILSYNNIETSQEVAKPGTTKRLIFHNVDNKVFLLESFQDVQSRDLYILTEAKKHNSSEISHINCIMCKNKYSFYDDPNECATLKVESIHQRRNFQELYSATFFKCKLPHHISIKDYTMSTLKISENYGHLVPINDIDKNKVEKNSTLITMCAGPQYGKKKKVVNLVEWIEFHRLMGVSKFQIYVTDKNSVSNEYHNMLKKYVKEGIVDLIY